MMCAEGGLSKARRPVKEHVVKGFAPHLGRLHIDVQIGHYLLLSGEIFHPCGRIIPSKSLSLPAFVLCGSNSVIRKCFNQYKDSENRRKKATSCSDVAQNQKSININECKYLDFLILIRMLIC